MKTWKVKSKTVFVVSDLYEKLSLVAPHYLSDLSTQKCLQLHKSGSEKGSRRAAEQGGVWQCLLVHPRVTASHFSFTQKRLLAFSSPKANSLHNYSFSLHMW